MSIRQSHELMREAVREGRHPLCPSTLAYLKGVKRFEDGRPSPPRPADDDPCTSPQAVEWLGWMLGRAGQLDERRRVRALLGLEDD